MVNLRDVAELLETNIVITVYPSQQRDDGQCRCTVQLESIETQNFKGEDILRKEYGNAYSIQEAIDNYVSLIRGKNLVKNAYSNNRREWQCPTHIQSVKL